MGDFDKEIEELREKLKKGALKNLAAAGAITAATVGAASPALAEMKPHKEISKHFVTQMAADKTASGSFAGMHQGGLFPIVHHDSDTGKFQLTIHDVNSKKPVGTIWSSGEMHFPTQNFNPQQWEAVKNHSDSWGDFFNGYINKINSGGFKPVKKSESWAVQAGLQPSQDEFMALAAKELGLPVNKEDAEALEKAREEAWGSTFSDWFKEASKPIERQGADTSVGRGRIDQNDISQLTEEERRILAIPVRHDD